MDAGGHGRGKWPAHATVLLKSTGIALRKPGMYLLLWHRFGGETAKAPGGAFVVPCTCVEH
ncbi:MAG: hypothetical protein LZF62_10070 [Nitrospira sp.]|nr:MAG: hypothetical protein LZF62_10070 [Nitrospira sp.]